MPELGLSLVREGRWGLVACVLTQAVQEDHQTPATRAGIHTWLGEALSRLDQNEEADHHLREAVRLAPDSPLPWLLLGNHTLDQDDLETARAALLNAQRLDPSNPAPCLAVAELKARAGRYEEVHTWVDAAVARAPEDVAVLKTAARFYLSHNLGIEEAQTIAEDAFALAPQDAEAQLLLGWSNLLAGIPSEALGYLDRAVATAPTLAEAHYLRARALSALGKYEAAEVARVRAINLGYKPDE